MATEKLQVKLELNHKAAYREKPTPEGFTHDWMVTIRGPNGSEIEHFVEKVVFYLHESFKKPKRNVKFPPYQIAESGYAGFTLPIDVCFRNKDEPKKITFYYDLFLHASGCPPVNNTRCEKLTFENPTPEFREKLLKAGAYVLDENHKSPSSETPSSPTKPSPGATPEAKRKEKEIPSGPRFPDLKKSATVKLEKAEHSKSSSDSKKSSHSSSQEKKKSLSLPSNTESKKPDVKKSPKPAPKLDSQFTDLFGAPIQKSSDSDKHKAKSSKPSKESKDHRDKKDSSEKSSVKSEKDSHSKDSSRKEEFKKHDKPSSSSSKEKEKDSFGSSSKDKDLKSSKDKAERSSHSSDKISTKDKKTHKDDSKDKSSSKEKKHDSSSSIKIKEEKKEKERPSSETKIHDDHKKSKSEKTDRPSSSMDKYKSDKIKKEKVEEKPKDSPKEKVREKSEKKHSDKHERSDSKISEKLDKIKKEIKEEKKPKFDHKVKEKSKSNESLLQRSSSRDSDISKHSESKQESKRARSRTPEPKKEKKREERKESIDKHKKSEIKDSHRDEKSSSKKEKEKEKSYKPEKKETLPREEKVKTTPKKSPKKDLPPVKKKAMEKLESLFSTGENSDDDPFDDDKRKSSSSSEDSDDDKSNASSFANLKVKDKPLRKLIKQAHESDSDPESPQSPPPEDTKPFVIEHSPLKREDTRGFSPSKSSEHSRKTSTSSELDRKFESSPKKRHGSVVKTPSPVKRPRLESEPDDVPTDPRLKRRDSVRKPSCGSESEKEKEKEVKADLQVSDSSSSSSSDSDNSDDENDEDRADGAENNNVKQTNSPIEFTEEYLIELVKIQQKLMASRDRDLVQKVVDLVGETDCFDVDVAFNFDLCSLDKGTVYRIKDLLQCAT